MLKLKTNIGADPVTVLIKDAVSEFYRAVDKHPLWPDVLTTIPQEEVEIALGWCRNQNDKASEHCSAYTIYSEEWFEFLEAAVIKRDRAAARHELTQCMAMLLRIGAHLDDYLP